MKKGISVIKQIVSVLLFVSIVFFILTRYGYIMRTRTRESSHITGITQVSNVDVFFVGNSNTFTAWMPYRAWEEYGITSFDYAVSGEMLGIETGLIRYIKHRHPETKIFVIDVREYIKEVDERKIPVGKINNMSYSIDRIYTILDFYQLCENEENEKSPVDSIFDILENQSNREVLGEPENWKYINNDVLASYLGCEIQPYHMSIREPEGWPKNKLPIDSFAERSLKHILQFADRNDIAILFTLMPYGATVEQMEKANTVAEIIEENGGTFLNMCGDFAPYEIDYSKDFYNPRHTNIFGAEKYTHYVGNYIMTNYDIVDHRGDQKYVEWDNCGEKAFEEERKAKDIIETEIKRKEANTTFMEDLTEFNNFYDWYNKAILAEDLSIFMVPKGQRFDTKGDADRIFEKLNLKNDDRLRCRWIFADGKIQDNGKKYDEGYIHGQETLWYVSQENDEASIILDDIEYSPQKEGVNVVAWDENKGELVDRFVLVSDGKGGVVMERD